jgi:hypothetical protein
MKIEHTSGLSAEYCQRHMADTQGVHSGTEEDRMALLLRSMLEPLEKTQQMFFT